MSLIERLRNTPFKEAIADAEGARRDFFRKNLFLTAKCLLNYKEMTWRTHGGICAALESPKRFKLLVMPRGTFKSTIGSVAYPIQRLIKNSNDRILLDSELYSNSKNFLREIKLHLEEPRLIRLFGSFKSSTWNEGEIIINQRTRIVKEATITCTGLGAEKTGQHYDCIVLDDMNSPSNSNTMEGCQKVIEHFRHLQAILEPGGTMVVIATRYSANDLPGFIIQNLLTGLLPSA